MRLITAAALLGSLIGAVYSLFFDTPAFLTILDGFVICGLFMALDLFVVEGVLSRLMRRMPFLLHIVSMTALWVFISLGTTRLFGWIFGDLRPIWWTLEFYRAISTTIAVGILLSLSMRFVRLIGVRVVWNLVRGHYRVALEENRIFVFLDLADSTTWTKELGAVAAYEIAAQFFHDVARLVIDYDGETHRFIGDEIVATWSLKSPGSKRRCLSCLLAIRAFMNDHGNDYQRAFSLTPTFRVGVHCGPVIAGEVGVDKHEIVYFGDTINSAARIGSLCKEKDRWILMSEEMIEGLPENVKKVEIGAVCLRGRDEETLLFSLID
jgi:adenylate cyclase